MYPIDSTDTLWSRLRRSPSPVGFLELYEMKCLWYVQSKCRGCSQPGEGETRINHKTSPHLNSASCSAQIHDDKSQAQRMRMITQNRGLGSHVGTGWPAGLRIPHPLTPSASSKTTLEASKSRANGKYRGGYFHPTTIRMTSKLHVFTVQVPSHLPRHLRHLAVGAL
jgi:hypothetical protein